MAGQETPGRALLAFQNDRYVLAADRLAAALSALEEYDRATPGLEVRP